MTASSLQERGQDSPAPCTDLDPALRQYCVPPHVRVCKTTTGAVLLDLKRNRYFSVGRKEAYTLFAVGPDAPCGTANLMDSPEGLTPQAVKRTADHLVQMGLLSGQPSTEPPIAPGEIELNGPLTSIGHELGRAARMNLGHACNFLRACTWARRAIRSRTLYAVAGEISAGKHRHPGNFETQRAVELVGIFRRLRPFAFTAKDRCLFHALALMRFLSFYQVFPTWVIGVRARPWAAHSWVQQGSLLLDSNPEHVCEYTPLLMV